MAAKHATMHRFVVLCAGACRCLSVSDIMSAACEDTRWAGSGAAMT